MEKDFWVGKNVLITGHMGFVGKNLAEALAAAGAFVYGIDKKDGRYNIRHLSDVSFKFSTIPYEGPTDIVFHLAAETQVGRAENDIVNTYQANIAGTINVLSQCIYYDIPVIVASSDKVYGSSQWPCDEHNDVVFGNGVYCDSKCYVDMITRDMCERSKLHAIITRSANIYGLNDENEARLIPGLINHILHDAPFSLRSNGKQVRSYIHISDAVSAYMLLAENLILGKISTGTVYNLVGHDQYFTALEICDMAGVQVNPIDGDNGELDEQIVYADPLSDLGWESKVDMEKFFEEILEMKNELTQKKTE